MVFACCNDYECLFGAQGTAFRRSSRRDSKANFIVKLNFEGTSMEQGGKTRAAQSTAVPETSWSNIHQVQILLYDASNIVRFSDVVTPTAGNTTFTYTDVPAGTYTMVAIANAKSSADAINTYLDGGTTPVEWGMWNVRQKQVQNMVMKYKTGTFPAFCSAALAGNTAYTERPKSLWELFRMWLFLRMRYATPLLML